MVVVRGGRPSESIYRLIRPYPNYYSAFTTAIHGLTRSDTENAPSFPDVWGEIAPRIEGLPLVAHNSPFDEGCLRAVFESACNGTLPDETVFLDLDRTLVEHQLAREAEQRHTGPVAESLNREVNERKILQGEEI